MIGFAGFAGVCCLFLTAGVCLGAGPAEYHAGAAATYRSEPLGDLMADLVSEDGTAAARARLLIPQYGGEAAGRLADLLSTGSATAARAAFTTLRDLVSARPEGAGDEGAEIHSHVAALLAEGTTVPAVRAGLELFPLSVPEDGDLEPVVRLLGGDDGELREKARAALEAVGSDGARDALRAALLESAEDEPFRAALIESLGQLGDERILPAMRRIVQDGGSTTALCAAARMLARTGSALDAKLIEDAAARTTGSAKAEMTAALMRSAERLREQGGAAAAAGIYLRALEGGEPEAKLAAVVGLGAIPSVRSALAILDSLKDIPDSQKSVAVGALQAMACPELATRLVGRYAGLPDNAKPAALAVLSGCGSTESLPLMTEAADSENLEIRLAAYRALAEAGAPGAVDALTSGMASEDYRESWTASMQLAVLAGRLAGTPERQEAASRAYESIVRLASDSALRSEGLRGLVLAPSAAATSTVLEAAKDKILRPAAIEALVGAIPELKREGRLADAEQSLEALLELNMPYDQITSMVETLREAGSGIDADRVLGTIRHWRVIGPFEAEDLDEGYATPFLEETSVTREMTEAVGADGATSWTKVVARGDDGAVSLIEALGDHHNCFAYAYAEVIVPERTVARLRFGSDDGAAVWINGSKAFENRVKRAMVPDEESVPLRLEAGANRILLKIAQGTMGWSFCARLTTKDGRAVAFTQAEDGKDAR